MIGDPFRSPGSYDGLPVISRARGYRLYGSGGERYLDMYLDGGGALLGHRPEGLNRIFKSASSRGLWAPVPAVSTGRLERAVKRLIPLPFESQIRLLPSLSASLTLLSSWLPETLTIDPLRCKALPPLAEKTVPILLWRPFTEGRFETLLTELSGSSSDHSFIILPLVPVPGWLSPQPVLIPAGMETLPFPGAEALSPALAEIGAEGFRMLAGKLREGYPQRTTDDVLQGRKLRGWNRIGPWLLWEEGDEGYRKLRKSMFEQKIILPGDQRIPAILPFDYTEGEITPFFQSRLEERLWKGMK